MIDSKVPLWRNLNEPEKQYLYFENNSHQIKVIDHQQCVFIYKNFLWNILNICTMDQLLPEGMNEVELF